MPAGPSDKYYPLQCDDRLLVICPHPDDETLACGELIYSAVRLGCALKIVFVTDGDNNPWLQRLSERRLLLGDAARVRLAKQRRLEALQALTILGVHESDSEFWAYPDQGVTALLVGNDRQLHDRLVAQLRTFRPSVVVAPSRIDLHPDHSACGLFVRSAVNRTKCQKPATWHYLVHGSLSAISAEDMVELPVNLAARKCKELALNAHRSQLVLGRKRFSSYINRCEYFIRNDASVTEGVRTACTNIGGWWRRSALRGVRMQGLSMSDARDQSSERQCFGGQAQHAEWLKLSARWGVWDYTGWLQVNPQKHSASSDRRVCCVIPCYNVDRYCATVITEVVHYADTVVAIDDGSTDGTRERLLALSKDQGNLRVLIHPRNRGKGAALLTAFRYAMAHLDFDVLVTLDADGQHRPCDMNRLVEVLRESDGVLAVAARDRIAAMPLRSRIGNGFMAKVTRWILPLAPADTQSGYRAHKRAFVAFLVEHLRGHRYETELQILAYALERGPVPVTFIPTVYQDNNSSSHFQPIRDSLRVLFALTKVAYLGTGLQWFRSTSEARDGSGLAVRMAEK